MYWLTLHWDSMFEDDSTSVGDVHVVVCSGRVCAAVIFCGSFIELC
jgi:hypothetical protein